MKPKVSILLATSRKRFLAETLDSIMAQTLQDFELIILDHENVFRGPTDKRITHVDVKGMGFTAMTNLGVKLASTDIIMHSSDDDIDLPHKAQTVYDAITNGADIFYTSFDTINEQGAFITNVPALPFDFDGFITKRHTIAIHTGGYKKSTAPRWREDLFLLSDYAFIIDAHLKGLNIVTATDPTIKFRMWKGQLSNSGDDKIKIQSVMAENKRICELYNLPVLNR